jgi:hypothetical protein
VKTNVYVDGFNLYYGAVKGTPFKWLDLAALTAKLFPRNEINRIRYFTAIVDARPPDLQQPVRQQTYLRALRTISNLSVHLGTFRTLPVRMTLVHPPRRGPKTAEVWKTEEKGSDVNLASYLLLDAFRKDCEVAIVFSNDADLKEPIAIAKNELKITLGGQSSSTGPPQPGSPADVLQTAPQGAGRIQWVPGGDDRRARAVPQASVLVAPADLAA